MEEHLLELFSTHTHTHTTVLVLRRRLTRVTTSALDLDGMRLTLRTCSQGITGPLENTVWFDFLEDVAERAGMVETLKHLKVFSAGPLGAHSTYILLCHVLLPLYLAFINFSVNCRWCSTDLKTLRVFKGLLKRKKVSERCVVGKYPKLLVIWLQPVRTQVVFL